MKQPIVFDKATQTLDIFLDACDVTSYDRERYHERIVAIADHFVEYLVEKRGRADETTHTFPSAMIAFELFNYVHQDQEDRYVDDQPLLTEVIDRFTHGQLKIGNCVGLSAFYAVLGERFGLNLSTIMVEGHVYLVCKEKGRDKEVFLEMTSHDGFEDVAPPEGHRRLPVDALAADMHLEMIKRHGAGWWNDFVEREVQVFREYFGTSTLKLRQWKYIPRKIQGHFKKARALAPHNQYVLNAHAQWLASVGQVQEAIQVLEQVRGEEIVRGAVDCEMSKLLCYTGNHDAAIDLINSAIKRNPKRYEFHEQRGLILQEMHRHYEATRSFVAALSKYHDGYTDERERLEFHIYHSPLPMKQKRELFEQVDPNMHSSYLNVVRGILEVESGEPEKAHKLFERAYDLGEASPEQYYDVGMWYMNAMDDLEVARDFFEMAVHENPAEYKYVWALAETHMRARDLKGGEKYLKMLKNNTFQEDQFTKKL